MESTIAILIGPILMVLTQLIKKYTGLSKNYTQIFMIIIASIGYAIYIKYAPDTMKLDIESLAAISVSTAGVLYQTLKAMGFFSTK